MKTMDERYGNDTNHMEECVLLNIQKEQEFYRKLESKKHFLDIIERKWKNLHK